MEVTKTVLLLCALVVAVVTAEEEHETAFPVLNPLDVRSLPNPVEGGVEAVPALNPFIVGVTICQVREIVLEANITHEQVAEFILKETPTRFRSKLYEEFVRGGSTLVAKLADLGCSITKVRSILTHMWPFGRLSNILRTLSKPFAGLGLTHEYEMIDDAIKYIEGHQGEKGLMLIPDTMCYVRRMANQRGVSKEQVIAEVESKMPDPLKKSLVDRILRYGVRGVARLADVGCKVLPVHVEIDVKNAVVPSNHFDSLDYVPEVPDIFNFALVTDVQPARLPVMFAASAFCKLLDELRSHGVTREKIIETINKVMPRPMRNHMIEKLTREGVNSLVNTARLGCKVMPRLRIAEEFDARMA